MEISKKVRNIFDKSFKWFANYMADKYLKSEVLIAMQKAYDLGKADGYAECFFDEHPELEEK